MELLTKQVEKDLKKNMALPEMDRRPVVKYFHPVGSATWLISEIDDDGDLLFGLCDLGMGFPELGYVALSELRAVKGPLGLGIERDRLWEADRTLKEYADAAKALGHIETGPYDPALVS